jgi:hypothetical protein
MNRSFEHLYHLAEASNLPSILEHGLMSTEKLLRLIRMPKPKREALLRGHRTESIRLSETMTIRDQRPMPPPALARALGGSLEPGDWYELLNSLVFLWPNRQRLEKHLGACRGRPQVLLTFDATTIANRFGTDCFVSPINSGNAMRLAVMRDRDTFMPYAEWLRDGWPTGQRMRPAAEFVLRRTLPAKAPYLIKVEHL